MKQLSVFVENKVGSLAKVTSRLKEAGINLRAVSSFDSPSYGILRMIVDQPEKAKEILHDAQFAVRLTEALGVELTDAPGSLDGMLQCLSAGNISVNYIYSFVLRAQAEPLMVVGVSDTEKASSCLKEAGFKVVEE